MSPSRARSPSPLPFPNLRHPHPGTESHGFVVDFLPALCYVLAGRKPLTTTVIGPPSNLSWESTMRLHYRSLLLVLVVLLPIACTKKTELPGSFPGGTRLPNRWVLTPAGKQIDVGDLPLNMVISPDGRLLAVTNNGFGRQFVSLIDLRTDSVVQELPVEKAFYGVAFSPRGDRLYASGGGDSQVLLWRIDGNRAVDKDSISLKGKRWAGKVFPAGLALSPDGARLYVAGNQDSSLIVVDVLKKRVIDRLTLGNFPYDVRVSPDGKKAFVSLWGAGRVSVIDLESGRPVASVRVGAHPNAMALSPNGGLLYVACANSDEVWIIDTESDSVIETIGLHPYANAPYGSTPNGLALSPDGTTLFVANADNNDVAVIDVSERGKSVVKGLIPAGWYPTAVAVSHDGKRLFVTNGKGLTSKPNPRGPNPNVKQTAETQYIGRLFTGTVSAIQVPDAPVLERYTRQVVKNNGFNEAAQKLTARARNTKPHALPRRVGEPSLIKHVVYIIKENRTYDQVLGDVPQGNGDPELCLFGRDVTPNQHALAERYVLLDNFYVDAEVSADGHEWSTGAIATDFVEKTWPTSYSRRGLAYPWGGGFSIAMPNSGYLWDAAARKGLTYRTYGEFLEQKGDSLVTKLPNLQGHFSPTYRAWDLSYPDTLRAEAFIQELHDFEARGELPQLILMWLPNDHTAGTRPGMLTPRAMVAGNDLALGRVVEAISHSRFWKDTAIFVVEDDAQNGPDHVDAHRTTAFVLGPYVRRGAVDHTMYDTVSMLRTIELILGLPPMSQYDAAALPMVNSFTDDADLTPYTALRPRVPLDETNQTTAYGAEESLAMDFRSEDAAPEIRLNEIIWKSIRGADSPMPPPIHSRRFPERDTDDE